MFDTATALSGCEGFIVRKAWRRRRADQLLQVVAVIVRDRSTVTGTDLPARQALRHREACVHRPGPANLHKAFEMSLPPPLPLGCDVTIVPIPV
jgi:hypothetical protein